MLYSDARQQGEGVGVWGSIMSINILEKILKKL